MSRAPRPTAAAVRAMRVHSWAGFKHKLHAAGVLASPVADVPLEWQIAFCRAFGRRHPLDPRQ